MASLTADFYGTTPRTVDPLITWWGWPFGDRGDSGQTSVEGVGIIVACRVQLRCFGALQSMRSKE